MKEKIKNESKLNDIAGGTEPEEFDWKTKGYVTPVKTDEDEKGWKFSPISNIDNFFKRIIDRNRNKE